MSKLKVFCIPYAGGTKQVYSDWIQKYSDTAEIIPLEYNGHGELFTMPFYEDADEAAQDICNRIAEEKPLDYILYGHSFGSMIAILAAEKLEKSYTRKPLAVMIGGSRPMHLRYKDRSLRNLSKDEFMKVLMNMGQTSEEIFEEPELVDIIYDIMYHDITIEETYVYISNEHDKITVPVIVMTGTEDDEAPLNDMKEWQNYTSSRFYIKQFHAGHFFPFNCSEFNDYFASMLKKIQLRHV
ncbi:MAG: hypothetical protein K2H01_11585 [Ruminococcus sp.]|nr:hypothetical protein [Ruminococcus sp.]